MNRAYPKHPLVGVGAIIFRGAEVLLVQRGREPSYGKWSVPGGLVEVGESLRKAVEREVFEEVGLKVTAQDLVAVLDRILPDESGRPRFHYVLLDFLCTYQGGEPRPASDALQCGFVAIETLGELALTAGTREVVRRAYSAHRGAEYPIYDPTL